MPLTKGRAIPAGQMRHQIIIEALTDGVGARGGPTESWSTFATVWGYIDLSSGSESFQSEQRFASGMGDVGIRYLSGLTTKHRVNFGGRFFDILSISNVEERNHTMWLTVKERLN